MDGSTASLIAIPIVTSVALAVWLIVTYYAAAHPRWKHGPQAAGQQNPAPADGQLRIAEPRLATQARADTDHDATPHKHGKRAA